MKHRYLFTLLTLCMGCSTETVVNSELPLGSMYGLVTVFDGQKLLTDRGGVNVQLEGTDFSTTTDSSGLWEIPNLPTRTYTVTYSKEGYGTMKQYGVLFVGGGYLAAPNQQLYKIPECGAELDAVREDIPGYVVAHAHVKCGWPTSSFAFFFSNSPDVSSSTFGAATQGMSQGEKGVFVTLDPRSPTHLGGLDPTDTIYVIAYSQGGEYYFDPVLKRMVFPSIHPEPSRVLSIILEK